MKVTLSDIAKETGFAVSTVSRTLRGEGKVSKDNERIILEAAQRLHYPVTRGIRSRRTGDIFIALVTQFHTGEFYASFLNGYIEAAQIKNVNVSLFSVSHDVEHVDVFINKLRDRGYAAAVVFVPGLHVTDYRRILKNVPVDFPLISCSNIMQPVLDTVTFDAYRGAALVAEHFQQRGYATVGMIEGPVDKPEARFRKNGFVDHAVHQSGIEFVWSYPGDYTLESGIRAYEAFEKLERKPRAIFAANDASALGFMESARSAGYHFPEDIALAGYDNLPMCEYHFPNITSVNTDYAMLAGVALEKLLERLEDNPPHQGLVSLVPVDLAIRNSS